jgi:hypothetical protein
MSDPRERMGVFGAHAARQGHDGLTHGDGVGSSTYHESTRPREREAGVPLPESCNHSRARRDADGPRHKSEYKKCDQNIL